MFKVRSVNSGKVGAVGISLVKAAKLSELSVPLQDVVHPDTMAFGPLVSLDFPQQGSGNKRGLVSRRQALLSLLSPLGQKGEN